MPVASPKEYNSSPIALGIAGAIVVSALGGWLMLINDRPTEAIDEPVANTVLAIAPSSTPSTESSFDVEVGLRKARLSADADLLVSPPRQNALYFYGRVLKADPGHQVANAELDALLALISVIVDDHLAANEFDDAYDLALSASRHMPGHPLVEKMRIDLNEYAEALVTTATRLVEEGDDDEATATLSVLEGLPGLSTDFVASAQQVVVEAQQSRLAAEQEKLDAKRRASEQADLEWQQKVRDAISAGYLLTPEGESARDYLEERDGDAELKDPLIAELQAALIAASRSSLEADELADAETYLIAAGEIGAEDEAFLSLQADVEQGLIEREGGAIIAITEFVHIDVKPVTYPPRANRRSITGWVDVAFTVTSTGQTSDIEILGAEPANVFNASVTEAVEKWTFVPRQYRGQPIDQRTAARLVFDLE